MSVASRFGDEGFVVTLASGRIAMVALMVCLLGLVAVSARAQIEGGETDSSSGSAEPGDDPGDAESHDPWAGAEEMVVTGTSTAGLIADITTSAIAFDSSELVDIGAQDVSDLARFTPSLEINTTSATTPTFFIRGVGLNDANSNAAGAVAIYVDDVPINAPAIQLAGLFDTAGVEVLRGPQAFIDARNASGGMINTVSRKPDGEFSAFLRSDFGNFGYYDIEGAIGVPVYRDVVSARFAFRRTYRDELMENGCGGLVQPDLGNPPMACNEGSLLGGAVPAGLPDEVNDLDRWGTRSQIRVAPPDAPGEMEWLLNFHTSRIDQYSPVGQTIGTASGRPLTGSRYIDPAIDDLYFRFLAEELDRTPRPSASEATASARFRTIEKVSEDISLARPFENDYDLVGDETLTQLGGFIRGDMKFGGVTIKTITGIEQHDRERDSDFDFSSNPSVHVLRNDDAIQYSQNLGFETELERVPVSLEGGGYLLVENLDAEADFLLQTNRLNRREISQSYSQDLYSFGLFGSFEWQILEDLTLEAGVRINWEQKDFEIGVQRSFFGRPPDPTVPAELTRTWSAPTGGVNFVWQMTEEIHAFWKYTRGWKSGHINASVLEIQGVDRVTSNPTIAQPEDIDAVEFGFGGLFLGGRLDLKVSSFYYKYTNYQVFLIESQVGSPPQLEIINANDARIYGVESDLKVEPLRDLEFVPVGLSGLTLKANFAWLESEFLDFSDIRTAFLPADPPEVNIGSFVVDFTGNRLPNTPQFKVSATIEWAFDLGRLGVLTPRYDVSWTDDVFFDPSEGRGTPQFGSMELLPKFAVGQRAYALHDLRVTYTNVSGHLSVSGWVRNLTNEVYKRNVLDLSTAFRQINAFIGDPRTYGLSASLKF